MRIRNLGLAILFVLWCLSTLGASEVRASPQTAASEEVVYIYDYRSISAGTWISFPFQCELEDQLVISWTVCDPIQEANLSVLNEYNYEFFLSNQPYQANITVLNNSNYISYAIAKAGLYFVVIRNDDTAGFTLFYQIEYLAATGSENEGAIGEDTEEEEQDSGNNEDVLPDLTVPGFPIECVLLALGMCTLFTILYHKNQKS